MAKTQYNVIDLFCGCGGMSLGFEQAGFDVLLGIDMWKDALVTFSKNHKIGNTLCADLANLQAEDVEKEIGNKNVANPSGMNSFKTRTRLSMKANAYWQNFKG